MLEGSGSIPGSGGGWKFTSFLYIQTDPGVHSASCKKVPELSRGKDQFEEVVEDMNEEIHTIL